VVKDPGTGAELTFLTSTPMCDSKIYKTHNQGTSNSEWLIFRSAWVTAEAMDVSEKSGEIVQTTDGGFTGMLNMARKFMNFYLILQKADSQAKNSLDIIKVDLAKLFADSKSGKLKPESTYQRICGSTPPEWETVGDMALDGDEQWVWLRVGKTEAQKHLPQGTKIEEAFGPWKMGEGPAGIAGMNIFTNKTKYVISVPFQIGYIQTNPWVPRKLIFAGKRMANRINEPGSSILTVLVCAHFILNRPLNG